MKKLLLLATVAVLTSFGANAQCTPDPQYTEPGVYPDSATGLPQACAGVAYDEVITIIVPVDTTVMVGPIPITLDFDSVVVSDWTGLPPGFTYSCSSPDNVFSPANSCTFEGDVTGCISIQGNPTLADIGSYQQIITTDTYMTPDNPIGGDPTVTIVDYYYIHIVDCGVGVETITNSKFLIYPNPAQSVITLNGLNDLDVESVSVVDMDGKELRNYTGVFGGDLDMDLNDLSSGMYFVKIKYNGTTETIKFIKE